MTSRQRLLSLVALGGLVTIGFLHPASARGLAVGHGFIGHPSFGRHGPRPILSPVIRHTRAFGSRRFLPQQPAWFPPLMGYDDQGPYSNFYAYPAAWPDEVGSGLNQVVPVVAHPPGCRTTTQTVPAERGGTSTVNITRCY